MGGDLHSNNRRAKAADEVFDGLIALNKKAFELGRYSAAYHALAAAQSWAGENDNEKQLAVVERMAHEQLVWIDLNAPKYEHSSQSAGLRGHTSIFHNLERQAHSAIGRIGSRRNIETMLRKWPDRG